MATISVSLRSVPGTEAAVGWAGSHTVVIDRPEGMAGGKGLGFSGGQMIALAIGGCFCNDLRYVAETMGVAIDTLAVDVDVDLAGSPLLVQSASVKVLVLAAAPDSDIDVLLHRAEIDSTVSNSIQSGFPIRFERV